MIVPAYNAEAFLNAALASIAGQSWPADEVVVIDDASTDDTATIARRWAHLLPLVLVERVQNEGLGAARKLGIEHATGTMIALLDADDYWMPDHLAVMVSTWKQHGGWVAADSISWLPGQRLGRNRWTDTAPNPPRWQQAERIITHNIGAYCALFSRADYDKAGGFRNLRTSEDWDLWIRMVRSGFQMSVAPTPTVIYRKRLDSLSAGDGCVSADIAILEGLLAEVSDEERPVVRRALRRYQAYQEFLAGFADVAAGSVGLARRRWLRVAARDSTLCWRRAGQRSVALRSLACFVAPRTALARHNARRSDPMLLTR